MSEQTIDKLTICGVFGFALLESFGFNGCGGVAVTIGLMRLFAVVGHVAPENGGKEAAND